MDSLPFTGEYTTYALQEANPQLIDYVTDSAASGTGWATGFKTSNGRISSIAGTGNAVTRFTTILELAQRAGYETGNVSTAELTDATPAVLDSHINERGCQGPADMTNCAPSKKENGGPGSIAEQSVDHHVNVQLGGGRQRFDQTITGGPHVGRTVVQSAQLQGYNVVFDAANLDAVDGRRPARATRVQHAERHDRGAVPGQRAARWTDVRRKPAPGQRAVARGDDGKSDRAAARRRWPGPVDIPR